MFGTITEVDASFNPGDARCILSVLRNLDVVDEGKLDWAQVVEFRKDHAARQKFRRLRNWLSSDMVGKTVQQVTDETAVRLDEYNWSIQKHGIQTVTGAISDLLEPSFIAATGTAVAGFGYAGGAGLAELAAGGIALGRVVASITTRLIDLSDRKHGQGSEVAFIHELKKMTK